ALRDGHDPVLAAGMPEELGDVGGQTLGVGIIALQFRHQGGVVKRFATAPQDFCGTVVEADQAFRIEQHVTALRLLPLQAEARVQAEGAGLWIETHSVMSMPSQATSTPSRSRMR